MSRRWLTAAIILWAIVCVLCLWAKADGYMGDADREFAEALERREEAYMAHRMDVKVTYYCCEKRPHICNAGPPYKTASGKTPAVGMCAADDIPLGSKVWVDWNDDGVIDEYLVVEDRFGGKQRNHIDIVVETHREALQLGRRTATIYWSKED